MKLKDIVRLSMLCALNIILSYFSFPIFENVKITFAFVTMSVIGYLYGPVTAGICGLVLDTVKFMVNPTGPYNPLWALTEILAGVIYGIFLYHKTVKLERCFVTKFSINLFCNILLTSFLLSLMYSKGFIYYASTRVLKNLILWPIESIIMYLILRVVVNLL